MEPNLLANMCALAVQGRGQMRPSVSLNTASPRSAQQALESKPTCFHLFMCCFACVVNAGRKCDCDSALPNVTFSASTGGRWGKPNYSMWMCLCGSRQKVRHLLNVWLLQRSMYGSMCIAADTHVRGPALWCKLCVGLCMGRGNCGSGARGVAALTTRDICAGSGH